jgi:hypothetical protein
MPRIERPSPYVWVSWIKGLLAKTDKCVWAAWLKAHYKYDKAPDTFDLSAWKKKHDELVGVIRSTMASDGWAVSLEEENSFRIEGQDATLSGKPDIVGRRDNVARIVDAKTGRPRVSDEWQVHIYGYARRIIEPELSVETALNYGSGDVDVIPPRNAASRITKVVRMVGSDSEPERTPSFRECRFCDIAECPDRVKGGPDRGRGAW